jgi:sugar phosphate isomerase/epimerase
MIKERLGVLTDEVSDNLVEALDWSAEQGLKHVEIRVVDGTNVIDLTDDQLSRVRREVETRGMYISAIASPVFKCALDPLRPVASGDTFGQREESVEAHYDKLHRAVEIAKLLGTRRIRIFSFWRERDPLAYEEQIVKHLQAAAAIAAKHDSLLLLENETSCNGGSAKEVGRYVSRVDSPALRALWDPGNEACGGRPAFPEGYGEVRNTLAHVHLKDAYVDENGKARCVPIGSGNVPYVDQLRALEADGYTGLYTIETHHIPPGGTKMDGTRLSLEALRRLLATHFS